MSVVEYELTSADRVSLRELSHRIRQLNGSPHGVSELVGEIVRSVEEGGDAALFELLKRYDGAIVDSDSIRVDTALADRSLENLDSQVKGALEMAAQNVRKVAEAQIPVENIDVSFADGHTVSKRSTPVRSAAAYVPGGRAPYPSTVIMTCVPAKVAGVDNLAICSPPSDNGQIPDAVLAAASICEVDTIYRMGGAQAISALALGTESVEPVDVIVGPGNAYVQEAKRQLFGRVGIDALAGPSELMVIVDSQSETQEIALDLLAQSEHGPDSLLILAGPDADVIKTITEQTERAVNDRETATDVNLAAVLTSSCEEAITLSEEIAPEHLELACADADALAERVTRAGCVFVGRNGATAFGDYIAGSNHVLPTGGAARFSSSLCPSTFMRYTSCVSLTDEAVSRLAGPAEVLARAEGFEIHAQSMQARAERERKS